MPNIFIHWLEGKKKDQKQKIVEGFTKVMEEVGIDKDVISIAFIENSPENIAKEASFCLKRSRNQMERIAGIAYNK